MNDQNNMQKRKLNDPPPNISGIKKTKVSCDKGFTETLSSVAKSNLDEVEFPVLDELAPANNNSEKIH